MSTLVVVTASYPFGSLTDFLEDEIAHLAAAFTEVVVAPMAPVDAVPQRMPPNVRLDLSLAGVTGRTRRLRRAVGGPRPLRELIEEMRTERAPRRHPEALGRLLLASGLRQSVRHWARTLDVDRATSVALTVWLCPATPALADAGFRTVSRAHGFDTYSTNHSHGFMPLRRAAVASAAAVHPVSDAGTAHLRSAMPDLGGRISTRRLGICGIGVRAPRSADGCLRVLSCSFLTEVKRPDRMVEAIAVLGTHGAVRWDHFGGGPLLPATKRAARTLPAAVDWTLHGAVSPDVIADHYRTGPVDALVNTSRSEGVPVSMMEALSAGVPIVGVDVGGVAEIVNPTTGQLLPSDAPAEVIADALRSTATEFDDAARARCVEWWHERYDSTVNYPAFAAELVTLARSGRTALK